MIIDGHRVLAEFISEEVDQEVVKKSEEWKINTFANHNIFCKSLSARIENAAIHFVRAI